MYHGAPQEIIPACDHSFMVNVYNASLRESDTPHFVTWLKGIFRCLFINSNKSSNDIKCLTPRNMCWDPICNVAESWCCSEHYLWLFDGGLYLNPFTAMYCCRAVVSEDPKTTLASSPQTLSLEGGSYSVSRCVRTWIKVIYAACIIHVVFVSGVCNKNNFLLGLLRYFWF